MKYRRRPKFLFLPFAIAGLALFTWGVMALWNNVLTEATGVHPVTYWQALGIFVLSKILFGFGGGWGPRRGARKWREMQEKFRNLTPEEKEEFKRKWDKNWGRCRPGDTREENNFTSPKAE